MVAAKMTTIWWKSKTDAVFFVLILLGMLFASLDDDCPDTTTTTALSAEERAEFNNDDDGDNNGSSPPAPPPSRTPKQTRDPNLYPIKFGNDTEWVYVQPPASSFFWHPRAKRLEPGYSLTRRHNYRNKPISRLCKFINLSRERLVGIFMQPVEDQRYPVLVKKFGPLMGAGFSTFSGKRFFVVDLETKDIVSRLDMPHDHTQSLFTYDPRSEGKEEAPAEGEEYDEPYRLWKNTLAFAETYYNSTGRSYLHAVGHHHDDKHRRRRRPHHFMWRADYFGQRHSIVTKETHFARLPPREILLDDDANYNPFSSSSFSSTVEMSPLGSIHAWPGDTNSHDVALKEYRTPHTTFLNLTLTALSYSPRIFECQDFLSPAEVQHLLDLGLGKTLSKSGSGQDRTPQDPSKGPTLARSTDNTRRSRNTWVFRYDSPVVDAIVRRAADLMGVDESLLRDYHHHSHRNGGDEEQQQQYGPATLDERLDRLSAAEPLQLVHYARGDEYKAHYDFGFPHILDPLQPTRFATLLFYLNDDFEGGETSFPHVSVVPKGGNDDDTTFEELRIKPQAGKAVFFYSMLPDGNMDVHSDHAALPIISGEKYVANLWLWDPILDYSSLR